MKLSKILVSLLLAGTVFNFSNTATAKVMQIEASGSYTVGDGPDENISLAKDRARMEAKRSAAEKAGVYVESYSKTERMVLTEDEVKAVSAGVLRIKNEDIKINTVDEKIIVFVCNIIAEVDTDNIDLKKIMADKNAVQDNIYLLKEIDRLKAENESLKIKFSQAQNNEQKAAVQKQISTNETYFKALQLLELGNQKFKEEKVNESLNYYKQAMQIADELIIDYPSSVEAHYLRLKIARLMAAAKVLIDNRYDDVLFGEQFKEANSIIKLNPNEKQFSEAIFDSYYTMALYYDLRTNNYVDALAAINNAIKIQPNNSSGYSLRSKINFEIGNIEECGKDANIAIQQGGNYPYMTHTYIYRSMYHLHKGDLAKAKNDLDIADEIAWPYDVSTKQLIAELRKNLQ